MELTTDWRRQATKAAGVTALAPAVLLGAAVLLAAGAGFGGLSSLGQVADGPPIPSVEQTAPSSGGRSASPAQSPVAALATPAPTPGGAAAAPARGGGIGGGTQVRSTAPVTEQQGPANTSPGTRTPTRTPTPSSPSTPQSGSTPTAPSQTAPVTPQAPLTPQTPQLPSTPGPVQQLLDIPKTLPNPVGPLTGRLLDTVTQGLLR